jgi:Tfp pilus assembly protein PilX
MPSCNKSGLRRSSGFVLPAVLGVLVLGGLLARQAMDELATHSMLSTHRLLHQRAFLEAERGLLHMVAQLRAGNAVPARHELAAAERPDEGATVELESAAMRTLPPGASIGRVREACLAIRSVGRSARMTKVTVIQEACRLEPVPE